ncbi:MAG: sulfite exporter TauE/SafE family protein, partial [Leptolyngbyaceae cyanobacterium MO_188.B28]|nr:sulfite exporter TauE/SafE family protein [Leptolyngbyaceae cyanobacterium MO_188.B28]
LKGNVVWMAGLLVGFGGLVGVQASTRFLPKLNDRIVNLLFRTMLCFLAANIFWQAWRTWQV